jgi:hypothetical protein
MKQILINRLEAILVAVGGAVPAPLVPSNFYARSLQLAELILVAIGGTVPPAVTPTNYKQRLLILLELSLTAEGQTPIPLTPIANFRDRLLTLLGQLLVFGGGSVPALTTPTNFEQRLLLLMDGLLAAAPNFVAPALQAETVAYENRVIALGSTLPAGAKTAIDAFFAAIKGQSYYSKIALLWLGAGPSSLAGLAAHLIYVPTATLTGFVAGDYVASGASAGLTGNGLSKRINHNLPASLASSDITLFAFKANSEGSSGPDVSFGDTNNNSGLLYTFFPSGSVAFWFCYSSSSQFLQVQGGSGFWMATRSAGQGSLRRDGTQRVTGSMGAGTPPTSAESVYSFGNTVAFSSSRLLLTGCALAFNSTEEIHFSTQVATLITALRA